MDMVKSVIKYWGNELELDNEYEFQKEVNAFFNADPAAFHDLFLGEMELLSDENIARIADNMLDAIMNIYEDGDSEHNRRFILFNSINKRKSRNGGFGAFGGDCIAFKDLTLGCLQLILEKKGIDMKGKLSEYLFADGYNRRFEKMPHRAVRDGIEQRVASAAFVPSKEIEALENYCFLNMNFGSYKWFPYFKEELLPLYMKATPIEREYGRYSKDAIVKLMESMIAYSCETGMSLAFDYQQTKLPDCIEPRITDDKGSGSGKWRISNALGSCEYVFKDDGGRRVAEIRITLHMGNIYDFSKRREIDPYFLLLVVYIHELAHFVYFSGKPILGKQFYPIDEKGQFDLSKFGDAKFHECIAQYFTSLLCGYDVDLEKTFDILGSHQSAEYHEWKKLSSLSIREVLDAICEISVGSRPRRVESLLQ